MWGAALHDISTGVHRPLRATLLLMEPREPAGESERLLLVSVDHCILDEEEIATIRAAVCAAIALRPEHFQLTLSHTHGAGWMSRNRSHLPGGERIGPYLDSMRQRIVDLARQAVQQLEPAAIVYHQGRCSLAAQRDFWDEERQCHVCGFNPMGQADDTLLLARLTDRQGEILGTIVNYACHPTTLAWDNTLISPDFVGALREVVESTTRAPCLFLQGASGDLGPREGFVGDVSIADRNGRQLGYAVLSHLEAIPPAETRFVYQGPVVSGTLIGTWAHQPLTEADRPRLRRWRQEYFPVDLPYRVDLPTREETTRQRDEWLAAETKARQGGDPVQIRDCRAMVEQMNRQLNRLQALPEGKVFPYPVALWQLGEAVWVLVPGELYQFFQVALRERFPGVPLLVSTLTGGWQPAYLPTAPTYCHNIYQQVIAAVGPGSLEILVESIAQRLAGMLARRD